MIIFISFFSSSCGDDGQSFFVIGNMKRKQELKELFSLLEKKEQNPEQKFIIISQIIKSLKESGNINRLNLFLATYVISNPEDPFDAFYLYRIGQNYLNNNSIPFAVHYFERILKNYPDLLYRKESIHFLCLSNLIKLPVFRISKVDYYKDLISRFGSKIEKGPTFYYLAKTYEELGEWDLSTQAYLNFLNSEESSVPGVPYAREHVEEMIKFHNSNKKWLVKDLDTLVSNIKDALSNVNPGKLYKYKAKVNFFTMSWEQKESEAIPEFISGFRSLLSKRVSFEKNLDIDSNNKEAYLRTWGWSTWRISEWHLYFRRVYYPADPGIHGKWEWAGIYFGKKPFAASRNGQ